MSLRDGMRNRKASPPSTTSANIKLFAFSIFGKRMLFQNPTLCMPTLKPLQSREGPFSLRLTDVESVLPDPYFHTVLARPTCQKFDKGKKPIQEEFFLVLHGKYGEEEEGGLGARERAPYAYAEKRESQKSY